MKPFIRFTKMHGLGNDFVVINGLTQVVPLNELNITTLANRHIGMGFDQLLLIESSQTADFFCRIFNADGSEAEQCGNGLRCVARYLHEEGLVSSQTFRIETKAGIFPVHVADYEHIRVTMGTPQVKNPLIPLTVASSSTPIEASILSMGNPHAIVRVVSFENLATELGKELSTHAHFPKGVNVGFMEVIDAHHIRLKTYERGSGETFACGSNASAAVIAGVVNDWLESPVTVALPYGSLFVEWPDKNQPVYLTGPATRVFEGQLAF